MGIHTPMNTADIVKAIRKDEGLTRRQIAKKIGVSEATVGNWETGRCQMTADNLIALAQATDREVVIKKKYNPGIDY